MAKLFRNGFKLLGIPIFGGNATDIRNSDYKNLFTFFGGSNKANVAVTPDTALKVSAFFSSIRNISEDTSRLPFRVMLKDSAGNKIEQPSHPAALLLNSKPNNYSIAMSLRSTIMERALRKGNGYAFIQRDDNATPVALHFIESEHVQPMLVDRKIYYRINDPILNIEGDFTADQVFHLRGMGDGFIGQSVVRFAAESLGIAIATQEFAGKFYGSGANMTGILKLIGAKDVTEGAKIKSAFQESYGKDGIAALPGNIEFQKINFSADEAQMLGARDFNVKDVARWFRMPLSKLQSENMGNIEALAIEYVNDCLEPWITRFEQEVAAKLFTEKERSNGLYEASIDTFPLLKGDTAAMERRVKTLFYVGAHSPNAILRSLGMNTIGIEGDRRYVPVNMVPADLVNEFWKGKSANQIPTGSPDASGSGASNGNIN
jgi:HK97 family phage portal protein